MSVSENFDRKFNKCMRGYNPDEVDAAVDALLRYCDELEDANREFEIANNDLIDDKTSLQAKVNALIEEKDALEKKISELSENMARIEETYNGYRQKFGEAKDLVTNAKSSASEILARAKAKAEIIAEETEKKRSEALSELDIEIEKRRLLIEKLDISYNEFSQALKEELSAMIGRVESFATVPILPDGLPKERPEIHIHTEISPELEEINTEKPEVLPDEEAVQTEIAEEIEPQAEPVSEEPKEEIIISVEEEISPLGPVWREVKTTATASRVSEMKNSLDAIGRKVSEKKSTPHI
ncbi:MAG: DivIVA domain-containing protein [Ruminococcaceae bacterium]|nr:DivIVA domain-containing protein [Oscillospiraceae bacterium]